MEQEQKLEHQHTASTSSNAAADKAVSQVGSCLSDEELAKKLQAEEDQMFERVQKQQKLVSSSSPPNRSKGPASSAVVNHSDRNIQNNSPLQQASRSGHHHHHHHPHQATTHRTDTRVSSDRHSSEANSDRDSVTSRSKTKNVCMSDKHYEQNENLIWIFFCPTVCHLLNKTYCIKLSQSSQIKLIILLY